MPPRFAGAALIGDRAKLKGVAHSVVSEKGEDVGREVQHHQVAGVLLAHQSAGEQGKAGLHEEHQISGEESPREIGSDPEVADVVGQLYRQRLFGQLGLVVVVVFLFLRVVGRVRVSGRGYHKRVARGIVVVVLSPVAVPAGSGAGPSSAKHGVDSIAQHHG